MKATMKWLAGAAVVMTAGALPGFAAADDAADLMKNSARHHQRGPGDRGSLHARRQTRNARDTRQSDRVLEQQQLRLPGRGARSKVAYADGFGENVWRRVTAMEFIEQALTYPEIGHIQYSSARGDASKAIADVQAYTSQGVDVIVVFADAGKALVSGDQGSDGTPESRSCCTTAPRPGQPGKTISRMSLRTFARWARSL